MADPGHLLADYHEISPDHEYKNLSYQSAQDSTNSPDSAAPTAANMEGGKIEELGENDRVALDETIRENLRRHPVAIRECYYSSIVEFASHFFLPGEQFSTPKPTDSILHFSSLIMAPPGLGRNKHGGQHGDGYVVVTDRRLLIVKQACVELSVLQNRIDEHVMMSVDHMLLKDSLRKQVETTSVTALRGDYHFFASLPLECLRDIELDFSAVTVTAITEARSSYLFSFAIWFLTIFLLIAACVNSHDAGVWFLFVLCLLTAIFWTVLVFRPDVLDKMPAWAQKWALTLQGRVTSHSPVSLRPSPISHSLFSSSLPSPTSSLLPASISFFQRWGPRVSIYLVGLGVALIFLGMTVHSGACGVVGAISTTLGLVYPIVLALQSCRATWKTAHGEDFVDETLDLEANPSSSIYTTKIFLQKSDSDRDFSENFYVTDGFSTSRIRNRNLHIMYQDPCVFEKTSKDFPPQRLMHWITIKLADDVPVPHVSKMVADLYRHTAIYQALLAGPSVQPPPLPSWPTSSQAKANRYHYDPEMKN
eukprot:TRINITY_DN4078_c0_g1_i5.p1 TRINITY_DN4078_c0_g1~~TRINITY_DN4078_c0_g1_i5.p1  ORF type:complete len:569 (-),score=125.60 TRINITY_DN4078_c0_g1_i5:98-1702(-)